MASLSIQLVVLVALAAAVGVQALDLEYQVPEHITAEIKQLEAERDLELKGFRPYFRTGRGHGIAHYSMILLAFQDVLGSLVKVADTLASNPELRDHEEAVYSQLRAEGYTKALGRIMEFTAKYADFQIGNFEYHFIERAIEANAEQGKFLGSAKDILAVGAASRLASSPQ